MMEKLALCWFIIIASGVVLYVILDGFDLGIGILSLFIRDEHERELMISSILPVWDGNETWLVFGGAALYGAFPLAFSHLLPSIYLPLLLMVIALLFRGVAFEFIQKAQKGKKIWYYSFFSGSLIATIVQGLILGTFVQGFHFDNFSFELTTSQWFNGFGVICALGLIFGYVLLASNWLIIKMTDKLQQRFYNLSTNLQFVIAIFVLLISLWTPFVDPHIAKIWFNPQLMPLLAFFPFITVIFIFLHAWGLKKQKERIPFWSAIGIFISCYCGFIISIYPYIVPRNITFLEAAANEKTLLFMLIGASIMLPLLLIYTFLAYYFFRGKVTSKLHY